MSHALALAGGSIIAMVDPLCPLGVDSLTGAAQPLTKRTDPIPAFSLPLTWGNLVQLLVTLPGAILDDALERWLLEQLIARSSQDLHLACPVPAGLTPYPWQVTAATAFAKFGEAMLSDDPGTGKTISALLGIAERQALEGDGLPALVVAPASVVSSWVAAARVWLPDVPVVDYRGASRALCAGISVTSYNTMALDADKLGGAGLRTLVLDEHHAVKSRKAKRTAAATKLAAAVPHTIALSGTPITHSPDDIFPVLRMIDAHTWPAHDRYVQRFCSVAAEADRGGLLVTGLRADHADEFNRTLLGVWRRVSKADALPFLPPKIRSQRVVEMPPHWRKAYNQFADTMSADLPEDGGELDVMSVLAQLTALMAMTAAPCKVWYEPDPDPERPDHVHVDMQPESWKVTALMDVLDERPVQQVLVFSPSRQLIGLAEAALREAGVGYTLIVGGQTARERDQGVAAFQAGTVRVCLATTQAGGVGLTLTAASTVVFLSRPFSYVDAVQAEDRAHRIGSERHESIEIIDIVTANSIDQRVAAILRERERSLADFLTGASSVRELLRGA